MQLTVKSLYTHLKKQLLPVYLISSDELLFLEEARQNILQAAKQQGFADREIMHAETGFQWERFTQATQNISLFSDKVLVDLRNHSAKFDTKAVDALMKFLNQPTSDTLIIISTKKLTSAQQKTKWFKAVDKVGAHLTIYPLRTNEYPQWIQQRAKKSLLNISVDAAKLLTHLTEGNLFAAAQAIDKCALLYPDETITPEQMTTVIADNTQFTVFDLVNSLLIGKTERVCNILSSLQQTGTEPILVLWAIAKEARELFNMSYKLQQGTPMPQILSSIWASKKPLVQHALKNVPIDILRKALESMADIDMIIKGAKFGDPWQAFTDVCLLLCKQPALSKQS